MSFIIFPKEQIFKLIRQFTVHKKEEEAFFKNAEKAIIEGQEISNTPENVKTVGLENPESANILQLLLRQALQQGISEDHFISRHVVKASEGNTAGEVNIITAGLSFALKIDNDRKLIREAIILNFMQERIDVPKELKYCFPKVYAVKNDKPPYAYLMEAYQRSSFARMLFQEKIDKELASRITTQFLNLVLPAYKCSINKVLKPNINGLYLERIRERVQSASAISNSFQKLVSTNLKINEILYFPLEYYLNKITTSIENFDVNFCSWVHGDIHPENILVYHTSQKLDLKFIDPKDWFQGDYMFDIGKFCHYLEFTGPIEKGEVDNKFHLNISKGEINYQIAQDYNGQHLTKLVKEKIGEFADSIQDSTWLPRFNLSMASNLLGLLPRFFLSKENIDKAYICYAEGLSYLNKCLR